jgi:DNA-binding protein HU-beta
LRLTEKEKPKMTTTTLIAAQVAAVTGLSKKPAAAAVDAVFAALKDHAVRGENVIIRDFGSFRVHVSDAKKGRNPATGEEMQIPETRTVKLRVAQALHDRLNPKRKVGGERNSPLPERKRA